jgi:hypothetical protein
VTPADACETTPIRAPHARHGMVGFSDALIRDMVGEYALLSSCLRTAAVQRNLPVTDRTPIEAVAAMLLTEVRR